MSNFKKTIFLDIDGCLIRHKGNLSTQILEEPELLEGSLIKLNEWEAAGHKIILTTGRKEPMRNITESQLSKLGIFYDQLIMGCNRGERIIINDKKNAFSNEPVVRAIEVFRNTGIKNIEL